MKLLFSLLMAAVFFTASAQVLGPDTNRQITESIRKRVEVGPVQEKPLTLLRFNTEFPSREEYTATVQKPGVYALPQDGMPCVVPGTTNIAIVPNAAPTVYPYRKDMPTGPQRKVPAK